MLHYWKRRRCIETMCGVYFHSGVDEQVTCSFDSLTITWNGIVIGHHASGFWLLVGCLVLIAGKFLFTSSSMKRIKYDPNVSYEGDEDFEQWFKQWEEEEKAKKEREAELKRIVDKWGFYD